MDWKITLPGVREYSEQYPVELVCNGETRGRLVIRAYNEGHNNETLVDFLDLIEWACFGPADGRVPNGIVLALAPPEDGAEEKE